MSENLSQKSIESITEIIKAADGDLESLLDAVENISSTFDINPFQVIERILRELESATYILSVPFEALKPNFISTLPNDPDKEYDYVGLFVDAGEMPKYLESLGLTYDENFERLSETGLHTPGPSNNILYELTSPWN